MRFVGNPVIFSQVWSMSSKNMNAGSKGRLPFLIALILLASSLIAQSQELVITGFPPGVGGDVDSSFFQPYYPRIQEIADTLQKYPSSLAIITGSADGIPYAKNDDSQNPGLALGRAHKLRDLMINNFHTDSDQIITQSSETKDKGDLFRSVSVRINWDFVHIESKIDTLAQRPTGQEKIIEIHEVEKSIYDAMGLYLGAGYSSSPFGGMPIIAGGITYGRIIYIEGIFGHTFWRNSFTYEGTDLSTIRRLAGGLALYYPVSDIPVGVAAGWIHTEEISRRFNEYVKMSEGPAAGIRITPVEYLSVTGLYNPSKHNISGKEKSEVKNNQFIFSMNFHLIFGGGK
jgi:hypothetical protein